MCHGCVYTGSFVLDYHALYLQYFMSIEWKSHIELFRNGLVQEFYSLKVLIILEQLITSVVGKKNNNLNQQNFKVYWQIRIEYRGIMDRGSVKKKLKIKWINKWWIRWWCGPQTVDKFTQNITPFAVLNTKFK